jgi:hypothetical protein
MSFLLPTISVDLVEHVEKHGASIVKPNTSGHVRAEMYQVQNSRLLQCNYNRLVNKFFDLYMQCKTEQYKELAY